MPMLMPVPLSLSGHSDILFHSTNGKHKQQGTIYLIAAVGEQLPSRKQMHLQRFWFSLQLQKVLVLCSVNRLLALHMHTHIIVLGTIENHVIVDVVMTRLYVIDPELYMVSEVGSTAPYQ